MNVFRKNRRHAHIEFIIEQKQQNLILMRHTYNAHVFLFVRLFASRFFLYVFVNNVFHVVRVERYQALVPSVRVCWLYVPMWHFLVRYANGTSAVRNKTKHFSIKKWIPFKWMPNEHKNNIHWNLTREIELRMPKLNPLFGYWEQAFFFSEIFFVLFLRAKRMEKTNKNTRIQTTTEGNENKTRAGDIYFDLELYW